MPWAAAVLVLAGAVTGFQFWVRYEHQIVETPAPAPVAYQRTDDPRVIALAIPWNQSGWCVGEFGARIKESSDEVRVSVVDRAQRGGGACAGVGTLNHLAYAYGTLKQPVGNRSVVRDSDGRALPDATPPGR